MSVSLFLRLERSLCFSAALVVMAWLMTTPVMAMPADLRLEDAVRLAVERAPAISARQSQTEAAREEARRAGALPDPKLTFGIDNLPVTGTDAFNTGADFMTMKRIGLMQEFPASAKRRARQSLADRTVEQTEALTLADQLQVQRDAATAWVTLWAAQRELDALQDLRKQSALAVRLAKARLAGGAGTAVDAMATQAAALELENRIETAIAGVEGAQAMLGRWLGGAPTELKTGDSPPDFTQLPVNEATLLASIDRQTPLLPWRSSEDVAAAQVDAATAEKHPDWSISTSYGQRDRGRSDMLMVQFAVDLPLFTANRQDRSIAARRAELDAVVALHEDARRMQTEQLRRGLAEWAGLKRQIARDDSQLLPLTRDRAQTALASYSAGSELQPWLDARRDDLDIRVTHARRLGDLGRAWAALAYLLPNEEVRP
jgi:cobalt-zinc-cadmium efflux system outer membrane protein